MTQAARPRRKRMTDKMVGDLQPKAKRYAVPDPELAGLLIRVTPNNVKTFIATARDPHGKQHYWATLGRADVVTIEQAASRRVLPSSGSRVRQASGRASTAEARIVQGRVRELAQAIRCQEQTPFGRRDQKVPRKVCLAGLGNARVHQHPAQRHHPVARPHRGQSRRHASGPGACPHPEHQQLARGERRQLCRPLREGHGTHRSQGSAAQAHPR